MQPNYVVDFDTIDNRDVALITKPEDERFGIIVLLATGHAWWMLDGAPTDDRPPWAEEGEERARAMGEPARVAVSFVAAAEVAAL
jgi:hypothetical protein